MSEIQTVAEPFFDPAWLVVLIGLTALAFYVVRRLAGRR